MVVYWQLRNHGVSRLLTGGRRNCWRWYWGEKIRLTGVVLRNRQHRLGRGRQFTITGDFYAKAIAK